MTAPCFKCGAARSCQHREVEPAREPPAKARSAIAPRHHGSTEDRLKAYAVTLKRTVSNNPVHRARIEAGIRERLGR